MKSTLQEVSGLSGGFQSHLPSQLVHFMLLRCWVHGSRQETHLNRLDAHLLEQPHVVQGTHIELVISGCALHSSAMNPPNHILPKKPF